MKRLRSVALISIFSVLGIFMSACSHNDNSEPADNIPETINLAPVKGPALSTDDLADLKTFLKTNQVHLVSRYVIQDPNSTSNSSSDMLRSEDSQFQIAVQSLKTHKKHRLAPPLFLATIVLKLTMKPINTPMTASC